MGTDNLILLEVLEWFDETGQELLHRLPERGSGEITVPSNGKSGASRRLSWGIAMKFW